VIQRFHAMGKDALVEEFCPGVDVTVPVLGHDLPFILGHVTPLSDKIGNILTEDLKLEDHLGYEMIDVNPLGDEIRNDIHKLWTATGPMDYFRADYRIDFTTGQRRLLEFNICCHIGESGAICLAGEQYGFDKNDILAHVVEYSLRRQLGVRDHSQWIL
jgi:D-alanine-D-alanine ligase